MQKPLVSVLMTSFNREKFIDEAIKSVLSSVYENFELIIVDDVSKDKTVSIAQSYATKDERIKVYINPKNLGDYPNRNKAAGYAKGKYIKYLDSDDIMYPHCLEVMVDSMEKFPEAGFGLSASGDIEKPYPVCLSSREAYLEHFGGKGLFNRAPGSSIIKKIAFDSVGGFSGLRQVGDFEFWLKIGCYFPVVKFPVDLYWSRIHGEQEYSVHTEKEKQVLRLNVIKKIFSEEKVSLNKQEMEKIITTSKMSLLKKMIRKIKTAD